MKNNWKFGFILIGLVAISIILTSILMDWNAFAYLPDFQNFKPEQHAENAAFSETPNYIRTIGSFLISFLVSVLLIYLLPAQILNIANRIKHPSLKILKLAVFGFLLVLFIGLIGVGSVLSFGTFPFLFFLFFLLFFSTWMGYISISYKIGIFLQERSGWFLGSPIIAFLIGHVLLFALFQIPIINLIGFILLLSLGLGSVVITRFGTNQPWSLSVLKEVY